MNIAKCRYWAAPIACLLMLNACQTAHMAVPGFLEERSDVLHCVGRQGFVRGEQFTFGDYEVERVRRGWVRRVSWDMALAEGHAARQEYEYQVRTPEGVIWQGHAVTGVRKEDIRGTAGRRGEWVWDLTSEVNYVVRFADEAQEHFWTLAMAEGLGDTVMNGELSDGETVYRVEGTYQLAGSPMPLSSPSGFIVYDKHRAVAAVEVINEGAVYLDRDLPVAQRDVLAVAATAILLYKDISDHRMR